jgi:hypothetical protein
MKPSRATTLALSGLAASAVVAAPAAQASDAGLRKTVIRHEKRIAPAAKAFGKADKALENAPDTNAVSAAVGDFRKGLRSFKTAIVPIKTQSAGYAAGKKQLLTAIREFDIGLVEYQKLLDQLNSGASKEQLKATFTTLNKRIAAAAEDEASALKKLKLTS